MDPHSSPRSPLESYKTALSLAYQSFGVVYGDLCTSPIYVYKSTFSGKLRLHEEDDEIFGVLSLVFWTLTLIPLCKYIIFVLGADDNGEGGTFALYSLLCRRTGVGLLRAHHAAGDDVSSEELGLSHKDSRTNTILKEIFSKHRSSRVVLLLIVLLGTSMVIADGVLTPSMSVLSAVYGIKIKATGLHENYALVITCLILAALFALQHFGTHRVGFLFAPILLAWLVCISGVGVYNIARWNPHVVSALSPHYIYKFFKQSGSDGWASLAGVFLSISGAEAMFADLGHFSKVSIRISFTAVVYPCLILAYMGEAAYLSKHKEDLQRSFYMAIPEKVFWPIFIIATLATVVGSQAIISATFSIISQCRALRCFPRVKVIHTSDQIHGQIYIPEVNWILMLLCLLVVVGFRDTNLIGHAYGIAVSTVMIVTTFLMFFIIVMMWNWSLLAAFGFIFIFGSIELLYFSACLAKVHRGGWFPLMFALIVFSVMYIWHYGTLKKHSYESENKLSLNMLLNLGPNLGINRVPGIGLVYTSVASGVPPMFAHFVTNFPAFHEVLIFVTFQHLTVPRVPIDQRYVVSRIGPSELRLYRCIVRFGYKDARMDTDAFERHLIDTVTNFLQFRTDDCSVRSSGEKMMVNQQEAIQVDHEDDEIAIRPVNGAAQRTVRFRGVGHGKEMEELEGAREAGLAYMMGNTCVLASESSSYLKKFVINIVYGFLRRNCRRPATALGVPHSSLIEVGMVYRV